MIAGALASKTFQSGSLSSGRPSPSMAPGCGKESSVAKVVGSRPSHEVGLVRNGVPLEPGAPGYLQPVNQGMVFPDSAIEALAP